MVFMKCSSLILIKSLQSDIIISEPTCAKYNIYSKLRVRCNLLELLSNCALFIKLKLVNCAF